MRSYFLLTFLSSMLSGISFVDGFSVRSHVAPQSAQQSKTATLAVANPATPAAKEVDSLWGTTRTECSRRAWIEAATAAATVVVATALAAPDAAGAVDGESSVAAGSNPFDAIRFELEDPSGGVAYLRQRLSDRNYDAVLEFTKQYDQVLRKAAMGRAKKLLPTKELRERGTELCNAVTFDLIGINRNARKGQENAEEAQRYLDELVNDARGLLDLEKYVEV